MRLLEWDSAPALRGRFPSPILAGGGFLLALLAFYGYSLRASFFRDDWLFLGPGAGHRFLADPVGALLSPQYYHFAPAAKLWYALQSLLFGAHPAPYHLVNILMMWAAVLLLDRYLRRLGLDPLPSFLGCLYFAVTVAHAEVVLWCTLTNYLLLGILLLVCLLQWEEYLASGRKDRLWALVPPFLAAQLVQSLALLIPVLFVARALSLRKGEAPVSLRNRTAVALGAVALSALCLFGSHLVFPGNVDPLERLQGGKGLLARPAAAILLTVNDSVLGFWWDSFWGLPPGPLTLPIAGLTLLLLGLWLLRRPAWRLLPLAGTFLLAGLAIPATALQIPPTQFIHSMRYSFFPDMGFALVLGVLFQASARSPRWMGRAVLLISSLAILLFLVSSWNNSRAFKSLWEENDRAVRRVTGEYRLAEERLLREAADRPFTIHDVPLAESLPPPTPGVLNLRQELDHATLHRFYFPRAGEDRVVFRPHHLGEPLPPSLLASDLVAVGGSLVPARSFRP